MLAFSELESKVMGCSEEGKGVEAQESGQTREMPWIARQHPGPA